VRGPAQEREIGGDGEFEIGRRAFAFHDHAYIPCRNQRGGAAGGMSR
jgi:hypothetical protein